MIAPTTKLGVVRVRVLEAATAADLQVAVNNFLAGLGSPVVRDEKLVAIQYQAMDATHYSALVAYTE